MLAKYHVHDIHTWEEDGLCDFHPVKTYSCKKCDEDEIHCPGELYQIIYLRANVTLHGKTGKKVNAQAC